MSVEAITWALKQRVRSATHKAVLLVLANRMDPTGFGWPSQKLVAKESQCCERTARKVLKDLEDDGILIRSDRRRKDGSYTTDAVQFAMPMDPAEDSAAGEPAANPADGKSCQRQDTTQPAANPAGLTTFEPNTKNLKIVARKATTPTPNLPEAIASYNEAAARRNWVTLREFTEKRRIAARKAWLRVGGAEGWRRLLAEAESQSFLGGNSARGWRMDFDFFVSDRGITHILEGKYKLPSEVVATAADPRELQRRADLWAFKGTWAPEWGPSPDQPGYAGPQPSSEFQAQGGAR